MKTLKINDKFSIVYDDENNDRPEYVERNGLRHSNMSVDMPNWIIAMFYALLEIKQQQENVLQANIQIETLRQEGDAWSNWTNSDI